MLSTIFPIVSSFSSLTERPQSRSFQNIHPTFLPIVISSRKAALKGRLFLNGTISVQATPFMPVFTVRERLHAFSPCIYQASWSDAAFGAASQSWKDICQSFLESSGVMVALEAACPLWGGHLHVLDDQAALWQRCLSLISSCTMPSITSPVTSFWYRGDTKQPVSMLFGMKSSAFLHCLC